MTTSSILMAKASSMPEATADQRQGNVKEHTLPAGPQIQGCFPNGRIKPRQPGLDIDENIGDTERGMGDYHRDHPKGNLKDGKNGKVSHAQNNFRDHNGDQGYVFQKPFGTELPARHAYCSQGS